MKLPSSQKGFAPIFVILAVVVLFGIGALYISVNKPQKSLNGSSSNTKVPEAPSGFSWKTCENMQARFLLPNGWFFQEEGKDDQTYCFFSRESIAKEGYFKTGLSVNTIKNFTAKESHLKPTVYAAQFIEGIKQLKDIKVRSIEQFLDQADLKGYRTVYDKSNVEYQGHKVGNITVSQNVLGDDTNNVFYLYWFESPAELYNKDMQDYGEMMITNFQTRINEADPDNFSRRQ